MNTMKSRRGVGIVSLVCLWLLAAGPASATIYTWNITGGGSWAVGGSWLPNSDYPRLADDSALVTAAVSGAAAVSLNSTAIKVGNLTIGDTDATHAYTIGTGGSLTFQATTGNATLNMVSTSAGDTIAAPVVLTSNLDIANNAAKILSFGGANNIISGAGNLTIGGASGGTVYLNSYLVTHTFTGTLTINAGTVRTNGLTSLGATSAGTTINSGGALDLYNTNGIPEPLTATGTGVGGTGAITNSYPTGAMAWGPVTMSGPLTIGSTSITILTGDVGDGGGAYALTKVGSGFLHLAGTSSYSGVTTVSAGALRAMDGAGLPTASALVLNGGVLETSGVFKRALGTAAGNVQINGGSGLASYGAGTAVRLNNGTATIAWNSANFVPTGSALVLGSASAGGWVDLQNGLDLAGADRTITVNDNPTTGADYAMVSGAISNSGAAAGLVKDGVGTLVLTGTNTWNSGAVTLVNGALRAAVGVGLPASTLIKFGGMTTTYPVFESSGTFSRSLGTTGAAVQWSGTSNGGFAAQGGPLAVQLNGGTAQVNWAAANFVPSGSMLVFGSATADNAVDFQNDLGFAAAARIIYVADNPSTTADYAKISGKLLNTNGLTKSGAGTLVLTNAGNSAYAGATTVSAGTLAIGGSGTLSTGALTLSNAVGVALDLGGTSQTVSNLTMSTNAGVGSLSNGTLNITGATATVTGGTVSASLAGTFNLLNNGAGTSVLSGLSTFTGTTSVTNSGGYSVNSLGLAGVPSALGAPALANATITLGAAGRTGTLQYTGPVTTSDRPFALVGSGGTIDASGTGTLTLDVASGNAVAGTATPLSLIGSGIGVVNDPVSISTGTLTKAGTGTWVLNAANSYTGATSISLGTLRLGNAGALGTTSGITVVSNGWLDLNGLAIGALPTTLNASAPGLLALYNSSGTAASLAGAVTLATDISLGGTGDYSLGGTVTSANRNLYKVGPDTVTLAGANSFGATGTTTVGSGTLAVTAQGATPLGGGALTLSAGTLKVNGVASNTNTAVGAMTTGGNAAIILNNTSGGNTTTLTAASLARATVGQGQTLVVTPATGTFGTKENLIFTAAPAKTNGIIAPWTVVQTAAADSTGDFVTWTGTTMLRGSYTTGDINTSTATTVFNATSGGANTVTGTRAAYALKVDTGVTVSEDVAGRTLTLGGGLILNGGTISTTTLALGAAEGDIYTSAAGGRINSAVTGSRAAGIAQIVKFGPGTLTIGGVSTGWVGNTVLNAGTIAFAAGANDRLPAGSGLFVGGAGTTLDLGGNTQNFGTIVVGKDLSNGAAPSLTVSNGTLRPTNITIAQETSGATTFSGTLTVTGTLDSSNLNSVIVGRNDASNTANYRTGLLDLSGATLVGNKLQMTSLDVGYETMATGKILLPNSLTNLTITGTARLGNWSGTNTISGDPFDPSGDHFLTMPATATLQIGTSAASPGNLAVGYHAITRTANGLPFCGYVTSGIKWAGPGGTFVGYLGDLDIGRGDDWNNSDWGTGVLDLSQTTVAGGALNAANLRIGATVAAGMRGKASGTLLLSPATGLSSLNVTGDFMVGTIANTGTGRIGQPSGSQYVLPSMNVNLGKDAATRGRLWVGWKGNSTDGMADGMLVTSGGTFGGYLSDVRVGVCDYSGTRSGSNGVIGLVDLRGSSLSATGMDVSGGFVHVGSYYSPLLNTAPSSGKLYLPAGNAVARGLAVGSAYGSSTGLLELFGTTFRVTNSTGGYVGWVAVTNPGVYASAPSVTITGDGTGATGTSTYATEGGNLQVINVANAGSGYTNATVTLGGTGGGTAIAIIENALNIYNSGDVFCHVGNISAGLDIASSMPGEFLVYDGGMLNINFEANPGDPANILWGLRMGGDNRILFSDYLASGKVAWSFTGSTMSLVNQNLVNIYYDAPGGFTYIGVPAAFVPEPAALACLAIGAALGLARRRTR